jgi:hypothetical protein
MTDEVIRDVRRIRHEISRCCDHDVHRVVAYYRAFQDELKASGKYRFFVKPSEGREGNEDQPDASRRDD